MVNPWFFWTLWGTHHWALNSQKTREFRRDRMQLKVIWDKTNKKQIGCSKNHKTSGGGSHVCTRETLIHLDRSRQGGNRIHGAIERAEEWWRIGQLRQINVFGRQPDPALRSSCEPLPLAHWQFQTPVARLSQFLADVLSRQKMSTQHLLGFFEANICHFLG